MVAERPCGFLPRCWSQWWLITLGWYAASILIIEALRTATHKLWLCVFGNMVVGWPLVAPLALWHGWESIRAHCGTLLFIAILGGFEMTLGNLSLYSIGPALATALNGCNIVLTFFVSAVLGADAANFKCVARLRCFTRTNAILTLAISLLAVGGVVTAVLGNDAWASSLPGIVLKLFSSLAYAFRFTCIKLSLGDREPEPLRIGVPRPSKFQLAFFANPMVGLIALFFTPVYEPSVVVPPVWQILAVAGCGTAILVLEFRLTELTSPLTVAVLASAHSIIIVLWFALRDHERLSAPQLAGFGITSVGSFLYAVSKKLPASTAGKQQQRQTGDDDRVTGSESYDSEATSDSGSSLESQSKL
mmetsp:Transcript_50988/g.157898  ORF Transcript_50988/g.157898 Transcript_50988/m.157898 type:complete len:361 (-) Transcript_50988:41-1123(-)